MPRSGLAEQSLADRLNSWKEIAAFFEKDVRTVRRWETERGLPVHRVPGGERSGVFAYASELKRWLHETSRVALEAASPAAVPIDGLAASALREEAGPDEVQETPPLQQPGCNDVPLRDRMPDTRLSFFQRCAIALVVLLLSAGSVFLWPNRHRQASVSAIVKTAHAAPVRQPVTPEAQDLYLRGRYLWNQRTEASLVQAVDLFTQAIVHDPGYAPAYAGLADSYILLRQYGHMADAEAFPRALAADQEALALDETSPEAHRTYAFLLNYWLWNFPAADREFQQAIALSPNDVQAHQWYATSLYSAGRFDEALREIDIGRRLEPGSIAILANRGLLLAAINPGASLAYLLEVEAANPNFASVHTEIATIDLQHGRYTEFLDESHKAAVLSGDASALAVLTAARLKLAHQGGFAMLHALEDGYGKLAEQGTHSAMDPAAFAMQGGNREQALHYLTLACTLHQAGFLRMDRDPTYNSLHGNAQFQILLKRRNRAVSP